MKLITKRLPENHNIFFYGDKHEGSVLSSAHGWGAFIKMVKSPYDGCVANYAADGGDAIEAIMVDDKRFSPDKLNEQLPLAQMNKAIEIREPIKDKLLYMLMGNHEFKLWRFGNLTEEMCKKLGTTYGTYSVRLTVQDLKGKLMYKVFDTHGVRGITSTADDPIRRRTNMELILKRQLRRKAGDCAVMIKHHTHKLFVCKPASELYLTDNGEQIQQGYTGWGQDEDYIHPDARWYGNAGSFLKLYGEGISGYAEIAEYDPVELGFLVLKVRNKKIVSLDPVYLNI